MNIVEYTTMAERERTYWWHLGRLRIMEVYLKRATAGKKRVKILNVGCGTGGTVPMLESFGTTDNVDVSDEAIKFMKLAGYKRVKKTDGKKLPYNDKTHDVLVAFDVLEHIKNETAALKEWKRVLKDDGAIVLTIPAYQWLWSGHDVSLHHHRRYTTKRVAEVAAKAGLVVDKKSYAVVFSIPLIVGFRFMNKLLRRKIDSETSYVDVPNWVNTAFAKLLYGEARLHKLMSLPFGTSVIAILRKPS